jgi:hypothetical protein
MIPMRRRNRSRTELRDGTFTTRGRMSAYGSAITLILAGLVCAGLVPGDPGQLLAIGLVGIGCVVLVSVVFMEIGFSEDRDRAQAGRDRLDGADRDLADPVAFGHAGPARSGPARTGPAPHRRAPRSLARQRGERRRLR